MNDKKKYELDDEDLDEVFGGINLVNMNGCQYFLPLQGGSEVVKCENCFYHHKDTSGQDYCTEQHQDIMDNLKIK